MSTPKRPSSQNGMAMLLAMLTVAWVAVLASMAIWNLWQRVEVETAERQRQQAFWLLQGATDWARVILREDGRSSQVDQLTEPWAVPLQEARLSSFLSSQPGFSQEAASALAQRVFLSGQITDMQGRLNLHNLIQGSNLSIADMLVWQRLFQTLQIPPGELQTLATAYQTSLQHKGAVPPEQVSQLTWLGLSAQSLQKLAPYICILPERTPVNLNTASAVVLQAAVPGLGLSQAQSVVRSRDAKPWMSMEEAQKAIGNKNLSSEAFSVNSRYFQVEGRLRIDSTQLQSSALVFRDGNNVKLLWRRLGAQMIGQFLTSLQ
jgi:general secretion pathway protein K